LFAIPWSPEWGAKLVVSPKTVETHSAALRKLGPMSAPDEHRRVLAVLAFLRS
jgi:hypothetical protein